VPQKRQELLVKRSEAFLQKVRSFLAKEPDLVIILLFNIRKVLKKKIAPQTFS